MVRYQSLLGVLLLAGLSLSAAGAGEHIVSSANRGSSVVDATHNAFGRALGNLDPKRWPRVLAGKKVFLREWKPAGTGSEAEDGLGPLFNANSCTRCHFKDGRGSRERQPGIPPLIFRLDPRGHHGWGRQIQDQAVGVLPEARVEVGYQELEGYYPDGDVYHLRRPIYQVKSRETAPRSSSRVPLSSQVPLSSRVPLSPRVPLSSRVPPILVGLGLLEAVDAESIIARADPQDVDRDGISGRVAWVDSSGQRVGRFGWKGARASLAEQVAGALAEDMGIASTRSATKGFGSQQLTAESQDGGPEISPQDFDLLIDYLRFLAPPARRPLTPASTRGEEIFGEIGCASCHRPRFLTARSRSDKEPQELAGQEIYPYTDLLLHDLGEDLADDGIGETLAEPGEWRTAPLWGLGLLPVVNGAVYLLHDGRARSFEEAILWHGGEALTARERFRNLTRQERQALLRFLQDV